MKNNSQDTWLKAAVIGSIWASFEIIFGSFFHSLRLPFAGTFMTFTSVILLIAFSYKWLDKGLYIKAGLIAALMRSLMPTSVILGPLIGILVEAFIFQVALNIFGRNFVAFALAGILAMFSAIVHKIVSIILIYGFDIVKILENLYYLFLHITHLNLPLKQLFYLVVGVYVFLGITAAFIGQYVGKNLTKIPYSSNIEFSNFKIKNDLFDTQNFKYDSKLIILHLILLVLFLLSLDFFPLNYSIIPIAIYLIWIWKRYAKTMRHLKRAGFWFQLLVIGIMAIWLWQDKVAGMMIGIKMILRAIVVVSSFTAISVELKNPLVKALLYKKGYSQLYASLGLATSAVPFIVKNISKDKKGLLNPFKILQKAINLSDILLQKFSAQFQNQTKNYIISGEPQSGKTTFLKQVLSELKIQNPDIKIGGIIAHGIDVGGIRYGFNIENIATGETTFLSSQDPEAGELKMGRFYFSKAGLNFGYEALTGDLTNLDILVIDEVGYLELNGQAWFEAIETAMTQSNLSIIMVVRKRLLKQILQLWKNKNFIIIDIKEHYPEQLTQMILKK